MSTKLDAKTVQALSDIANKLRIHSVESTIASNSGLVNYYRKMAY